MMLAGETRVCSTAGLTHVTTWSIVLVQRVSAAVSQHLPVQHSQIALARVEWPSMAFSS